MSSICKSILERLVLVTKQEWQEKFDMGDLKVRQYVAASGQSAIITKTQGKTKLYYRLKLNLYHYLILGEDLATIPKIYESFHEQHS